MTSKTTPILRFLAPALLSTAITLGAQAQPAASTSTASTTAATAEATETADGFDSRATRDELSSILERHPRGVGVMLKLDPTLFRNEAWIASYPALREFIAAHPEVPQNASYYLERVWVPGDEPLDPAAVRTTRDLTERISVFVVMLTLLSAAGWLVRTLLEHRRWSRVSKVQTEIYNKLLDRFTSHEDLMRYVQSEAGRNFIQSAISPISTGNSPQIAAPVGRILWSAQAGVVLVMLGVGLQLVSSRLHADVSGSISTLGVLSICTGIGFALSAFVAWVVSRRLGILPPSANEIETASAPARTLGE